MTWNNELSIPWHSQKKMSFSADLASWLSSVRRLLFPVITESFKDFGCYNDVTRECLIIPPKKLSDLYRNADNDSANNDWSIEEKMGHESFLLTSLFLNWTDCFKRLES